MQDRGTVELSERDMVATTVRANAGPDLRLGRIALRRGLLSREALDRTLEEQARAPRPLGEILVSRGLLTDTCLTKLLDDQKAARTAAPASPLAAADASLGGILVENGVITAAQLAECLRDQKSGEAGKPLLLGEILVRKGFVGPARISDALARQKKTILVCRACDRRYNAIAFNPGAAYHCQECAGRLAPLPVLDDVRVADPQEAPLVAPGAEPARTSSDPTDRPSGRFKLGKYTVVRMLGQGGMGVVFEALDTTLGRRVALKMLVLDGDTRDPKAEERRFLREARLFASLPKHPSVVGVYEAGVIDGRRYLAMEYIEGIPFSKWRATAPVTRQVEVLRDTALAAHHAHEQGIVHRDLKPENVLIDAAGHPHLTDFGLAVPANRGPSSSLTDTGCVVGTPGYMSPEQARGETNLGRKTDVYALGVMLFEILAGRVPFQGPSAVDVMVRILTAPIPRPSTVARAPIDAPNPAELERICLNAASKDPAGRYATALEFADHLSRWLRGERSPRPRRLRPSSTPS